MWSQWTIGHQVLISLTISCCNTNLMEIFFRCISIPNHNINPIFFVYHDRKIVSYANFQIMIPLKFWWKQNTSSIEFELQWKSCWWNKPQALQTTHTNSKNIIKILVVENLSYKYAWDQRLKEFNPSQNHRNIQSVHRVPSTQTCNSFWQDELCWTVLKITKDKFTFWIVSSIRLHQIRWKYVQNKNTCCLSNTANTKPADPLVA